VSRVAFASEEGHVVVHDLATGAQQDLSDRGRHSAEPGSEIVDNWPTWSPDGRRVAYIRVETVGGQIRRAGVWVVDADASKSAEVYSATDGGPIYLAWAPNGERLGVLVQVGNSLSLRVVDARSPRPAVTAAQGNPLYFSWCADSQTIMAHIGSRGVSTATMRLLLIRLRGGTAAREPIGASPAPGFRAPAWSPRDGAGTFAFARDDGAEIAVQAGPDAPVRPIATTGPAPAFAWSPDGQALAFAARETAEPGAYLGVAVTSAEGGVPRTLVDVPVLAFFWCPDGRRIVLFGGDAVGRLVHVQAAEVTTGTRTDLGWVRPTRDFWFLLSHFDQYARSMPLVSADATRVVLAAAHAKEWENGVVPTVRQVIARPISGEANDGVVGRGRTASWAPVDA
jgi:Tol biopolymer transport system component